MQVAPSAFARTIPSVAASEWPWSVGSRRTSRGVGTALGALHRNLLGPALASHQDHALDLARAVERDEDVGQHRAQDGGAPGRPDRLDDSRLRVREALDGEDDGGPQTAGALRPSRGCGRPGRDAALLAVHEGGADERFDPLGRRVGIALVDDDPIQEPRVERGDAGCADRPPDRFHERLGRALDRPAGDERADGDDRSG